MPDPARSLSPESAAWALGAIGAGLAAGFVAVHHPLWPSGVAAALAGWLLVAYRYPSAWLFVLPATLPALNLSPWTGWIGIEELDLLVLGTVAAGYARLAGHPAQRPQALSRRGKAVVVLVAALTALGLGRGVADAGGWHFDWFQGYTEPLNSMRVAKSAIHALLLLPLLRREWLADSELAFRRFALGMLAGAAVLTAAVLWERAAYPGLFNLSAPYRTVGLFWEMHVGGAAIDAYVVLCTPFVAWSLWAARSKWLWLASAAFALLWAYTCLTTFSRGVYFGGGVSLLALGLLLPQVRERHWWTAARAIAFLLGAAVLLALVLDEWGYWAAALALVALGAGFWLRWRSDAARRQRKLAAGLLVLALIFEAVVMVGPDSFMSTRIARTTLDYESRSAHWARGLGLLDGPLDWLLGLGIGRLPSHYDRFAPRGEFSGSAEWRSDGRGGGYAQIAGPRSRPGLGGLHGLTHRAPWRASYRLALDLRADKTTDVVVRLCESHLLYDGRCQSSWIRLAPAARDSSAWQRREVRLGGPLMSGGRGLLRRGTVLTISVVGVAGRVDIDNVDLAGPGGDTLLANGDFSAGMARWLPAAQGHFVPWHIDSLYVETLVERGIVGLLLLAAGMAAVLLRLEPLTNPVGTAAPFVAAAAIGLLCIGVISSVLDVPRVALIAALLFTMRFLQARPRPDQVNKATASRARTSSTGTGARAHPAARLSRFLTFADIKTCTPEQRGGKSTTCHTWHMCCYRLPTTKGSLMACKKIASGLVGAVAVLLSSNALASLIDLSALGTGGAQVCQSINDGAIACNTNTNSGTVGTGVFPAFLGAPGGRPAAYQIYNTEAKPTSAPENEAGTPANDNSPVTLSQLGVQTVSGISYAVFRLDINQTKPESFLSVDEISIYLSPTGTLTGYDASTGTLGGVSAIWSLTDADDIKLDYNNAAGSGNGVDMYLLIPTSKFVGTLTTHVQLYSHFGNVFANNDGFEEWSYLACKAGAVCLPPLCTPGVDCGPNETPEPAILALIGLGLAGLGFRRRRKPQR